MAANGIPSSNDDLSPTTKEGGKTILERSELDNGIGTAGGLDTDVQAYCLTCLDQRCGREIPRRYCGGAFRAACGDRAWTSLDAMVSPTERVEGRYLYLSAAVNAGLSAEYRLKI